MIRIPGLPAPCGSGIRQGAERRGCAGQMQRVGRRAHGGGSVCDVCGKRSGEFVAQDAGELEMGRGWFGGCWFGGCWGEGDGPGVAFAEECV